MANQTELILVRYGELSTKGKNRKEFIGQLARNIRTAIHEKGMEVVPTHDHIYIHLNGHDEEKIVVALKKVFGIRSFSLVKKIASDMDTILAETLTLAQSKADSAKTFKVITKRHDKTFEVRSDGVNRAVATNILKNTELKVDVHEPELKIMLEIRREGTYLTTDIILGAQGYPIGVQGKSMLLLSGGIDSPVAAYLMMKRGVVLEAIHYASPPYTSNQAREKVLTLAKMLSEYQGKMRVHLVPFTDVQLAIQKHVPESYNITIMRRMMMRIAERLARSRNCKCLSTGESLGQVASQTLESMDVINAPISIPMLRPCVCMDKLEIMDLSRKIGTYETSILPYEDCCTIFTPRNPVTKPKMDKCEELEANFDWETLLNEAYQNIEVVHVDPNEHEVDELNLF